MNHSIKISLLVSILFLFSCETDVDYDPFTDSNIPEIEYPTKEDVDAIIEDALQDRTQQFQCEGNTGIFSFTSEKGAIVNLDTNCLEDSSGNAVTGTVEIEFIEIYTKGNMLVTNKPTMGLMDDGVTKSILKTGGEFFIELTQDGEVLSTNCNYNVQIPTDLTNDPDMGMTIWYGAIDGDGDLTWEEEEQGQGVFLEGNFYFSFLEEFGWCNVDIFYNTPDPKTTIYVGVPEGYDNENSHIYLSYDGEEYTDGLAKLDTYDETLELFSEHYGQVPVGLELHVIFISESGGDYLYAIQSQTIEADEVIEITSEELEVATEEELVALIDALP